MFLSLSVSLAGKQGQTSQILYTKRAALSSQASAAFSPTSSASASSLPLGSPESRLPPSRPAPVPSSPSQSQAAVRAREFAADLFRRAQGGGGGGGGGKENEGQTEKRKADGGEKEAARVPGDKGINVESGREEEDSRERREEERRTSLPHASTSAGSRSLPQCPEQVMSPASSSSSPSSPPTPSSSQEAGPSEPGYVNYSRLQYCLQQPGAAEQHAGGERKRKTQRTVDRENVFSCWLAFFISVSFSTGYEDDKVQLPFTVTDLKGRNLQLVTGPHSGQVSDVPVYLCSCRFRDVQI